MGAMMGGSVGVIIGFIFGTVNIFRYGAGPNGIMRTLGQFMLGSGATFGYELPFFFCLSGAELTSLPWQLLHVDRQRHQVRLVAHRRASICSVEEAATHHGGPGLSGTLP